MNYRYPTHKIIPVAETHMALILYAGQQKKKIHFVGIKGVGMVGLAQILAARGFLVSGSDTHEKFFTDGVLRRLRIPVKEGFRAGNVPKDADAVIASAAYYQERKALPVRQAGQSPARPAGGAKRKALNPEIQKAMRGKIPILTYPEAVGELFNNAYGIAVGGSHGKSTTSAMLAVTLEKLGFDPTAVIGTRVDNWGMNARVSKAQSPARPAGGAKPCPSGRRGKAQNLKSDLQLAISHKPFVLEADEYRDAFLHYRPKALVLTNIDWDHPDYFKTPQAYEYAFAKFLAHVDPGGFVVACGDDRAIRKIIAKRKAQSAKRILFYGFGGNNELRIMNYTLQPDGMHVTLSWRGKNIGAFHTRLYGEHNVLNATAVVGTCLLLSKAQSAKRKAQNLKSDLRLAISHTRIKRALRAFQGTARRLEFLTERKAISHKLVVIDDYAHHPAEIRATLKTVRDLFPKRPIIAVFQPHTYSRTKALFSDFAQSFADADKVYILETYASAREPRTRASTVRGKQGDACMAKKLVAAVAQHYSSVQYVPDISTAVRVLKKITLHSSLLTPHLPIVITLGAGDVWRVGESLLKKKSHP